MFKPFARCLLALALLSPSLAFAQAAKIDVPAGDLVTALDTLAHQTGMQFVYSADQLDGFRHCQKIDGASQKCCAHWRRLRKCNPD